MRAHNLFRFDSIRFRCRVPISLALTRLLRPLAPVPQRYVVLNSPKRLWGSYVDQATSLQQRGARLLDQGRYSDAQEAYDDALAIQRRTISLSDPRVAITLNGQGTVYRCLGHYDRADRLHRRALKIQESALGNDHADVAATLNEVGLLMLVQQRMIEAERHLNRSLQIRRRELDPRDLRLATTMNNLGMALKNSPDYARAKDLHKEALEIQSVVLGEDCPEYCRDFVHAWHELDGRGGVRRGGGAAEARVGDPEAAADGEPP